MATSHGFELLRDVRIDELDTRARLYRHAATGAELLSLENDDENKCFGIAFRTPPADSTGVAHIMEHSVLAGSEKYPSKDPFIELAKGSLKTFLNAFTFPDKTVYPVASTNTQDLYNLIDVYMDAVLHPLLARHTFEQQAWHYELDSLDAPLSIKGVVYNEMRGVYSSPDSLIGELGQQNLFPDTPYGKDSGGDPEVIPTLTCEDFLAFHRAYYHPSNARIYVYGDDDPEERLRRMATYLEGYERREVDSSIPLQARLEGVRRITAPYPVSADEDATGSDGSGRGKGFVTVNWLLPEVTDPKMSLSMSMLSYILIGTPASPLRKALIDSGLGEDLAGGGLESDLRQMTFSTGLRGIRVEDAPRVEELIDGTLARLVDEGIDPEMAEAALNTAEFSLRENNTGRYPRGLSLMVRSLRTWLHGGDPLAPIAFEAPLNAIKEAVATDGRYFEPLIQEHLLANGSRAVIVLTPDPGLGDRQEEEERQRLATVRSSLGETELRAIVDNTHYLRQLQQTPDPPEVLARIPSLSIEDLNRQAPTIPIEELEEAGTRVLYHDIFTNGILYLDLAMDLHVLPQELLPYVPLFAQALTGMGTEDEDYVKLSQRIGRKTGGVSHTALVSATYEPGVSQTWLVLRGKSTMAQAPDLLAILRDILLKVRLDDRERFRQMLLEDRAESEAGLIPGGHAVVNTRLRSKFDEAGWVGEQTGGVDYLLFLRELDERTRSDWDGVRAALERLRALIVNRATMICNVTLDAENWATVRPQLASFLNDLPREEATRVAWTPRHVLDDEGLTAPAQVNYVGKGANLYELGYTRHGSIAVIANHLHGTWIWDRVRVQGGAYGGFCAFDQRAGVWTFLSYRDPNLLETIDVYDETGRFLRELDLSRQELTKSIIGTIGNLDAYMLPDAKGFTSMVRHLVGETDAIRQARREEVLGTTIDDFRRFADVMDALRDAGRVVMLGSPEAVRAANEARGKWLTITRVL